MAKRYSKPKKTREIKTRESFATAGEFVRYLAGTPKPATPQEQRRYESRGQMHLDIGGVDGPVHTD